MTLKKIVLIGAILLIVLAVGHAVHVGRSDDVEPYLWLASAFMAMQGLLTVVLLRGAGDHA